MRALELKKLCGGEEDEEDVKRRKKVHCNRRY